MTERKGVVWEFGNPYIGDGVIDFPLPTFDEYDLLKSQTKDLRGFVGESVRKRMAEMGGRFGEGCPRVPDFVRDEVIVVNVDSDYEAVFSEDIIGMAL